MKQKIVELIRDSKSKYWEAFPNEEFEFVDEGSDEANLLEELDSRLADDIIALVKIGI